MNYKRFYALVEQTSSVVASLWDQARYELKVVEVKDALAQMSTGEAHMFRFFASIWFHENRYGFDLAEATKILDKKNRAIIASWLNDPFYP